MRNDAEASCSDDGDGGQAAPLVIRIGERSPHLVLDVFETKGYVEYDEDKDDGIWHVYWKASRFKPSEYAEASAVQRVNHFPKTTGITKKDALLRNLRRMRAIHGAIFNFFPESYLLPTEYTTLVRRVESIKGEKPIWIVKPTDSSQGRKIFIIRDVAEISYGRFSEMMAADPFGDTPARDPDADPKLDDRGRAISMELDMKATLSMLKSRLHKTITPCVKFTELHIVQRYIERPLCFHGYKLDLRIYVLVLSAAPLQMYWYRDCLVRFATQKYDLGDLDNSYAHLTNTSINKNSNSYATVKEGIRAGCKWCAPAASWLSLRAVHVNRSCEPRAASWPSPRASSEASLRRPAGCNGVLGSGSGPGPAGCNRVLGSGSGPGPAGCNGVLGGVEKGRECTRTALARALALRRSLVHAHAHAHST